MKIQSTRFSGYDSVHGASYPETTWTTTNIKEGLPGVMTPLGWSIWGPSIEWTFRQTYRQMGVLSAREALIPDKIEDRICGIFYGNAVLNGNLICDMAVRFPGSSAIDAIEQMFTGATPRNFSRQAVYRYYPSVALRFPMAFLRAPRRVRQARAETEAWYASAIARVAGADLDEARECFTEAVERFYANLFCQGFFRTVCGSLVFAQLSELAAEAGDIGQGLMSGYGSHEELDMISDLWACSRDALDLDTFVTRHGYHGPAEGELSSAVWREDRKPLLRIIDGYRAMNESADPVAASARRIVEREQAERRLLAALPASRRLTARVVLSLARRYMPVTAVGKVAFLQSFDVVRASARRIGEQLHKQNVLDAPDDVFYLTANEIYDARWNGATERVASRRQERKKYQDVELPVAWEGIPVVKPAPGMRDAADDEGGGTAIVIKGIGVSPGMVEGRAVVLSEPGDADIEPGDILVAHTTDPGWASIMFLSSALVIDIGGLLSHAAIVARELGIPCIANTRNGTTVLRTGDYCRVDGTTGRVEVLQRAANAGPV